MKCLIVFAAILAVSSAQFGGFGQPRQKPLVPRLPAPRAQAFPSFPSPPPRPQVPVSRPQAPVPRPAAAVRASASDQAAVIVRYDNDINPDGSFNYSFETDNGIAAQAQGTPRDFGGNPPAIADVFQGAFSWTSPEGQPISIVYTADENGYRPSGDAIPTSPPIPPQILRSLEYIARNAPQQKK